MAVVLSPLHQKFIKTFPEKISDLRSAFNEFNANGDISSLHHLVHKLVGSGGIYGFMEISKKAQNTLKIITAAEQDRQVIGELVEVLCAEIALQYEGNKAALN